MIECLLQVIFVVLVGYTTGATAVVTYVIAAFLAIAFGWVVAVIMFLALVYFDYQWWYCLFFAKTAIIAEYYHLLRYRIVGDDRELAQAAFSGIPTKIEFLCTVMGLIALGGLIHSMM